MMIRAAWSYEITIGGARVKTGVDMKPREVSVHSKTWPTPEETKSNIQPHNFEVSSMYSP